MQDQDVLTVGEFRRALEGCSDSDRLTFSGGLTFYRIKRWSEDEHFIEFNQPTAYLSDDFKQRNPGLQAAFMSIDDVEWDESGIVGGPIDVELR